MISRMNPGGRLSELRLTYWSYWTRGEPGRPTPPEVHSTLYRLWLVALALKMLGSTWDVSWHFRWLRDDLAPPHLINTVGTTLAVALVIAHTYTGYGVDKRSLRLLQWGMGIFLVAAPLDVINHKVNGLDITAWSPSHALLYLGTAIIIAGLILAYSRERAGGRERVFTLTALWLFFLENVHFPAQHQEYGVLELASWDRGEPYAEKMLMDFAAEQLGRPLDRMAIVDFSLPVPDWVYPLWTVAATILVLVLARMTAGRRWTATAIAVAYLAYRGLFTLFLLGTGFPPSALPYFLVLAALAVDLVFAVRLAPAVRAIGGGVVVAGVAYGALAAQARWLVAPPSLYASAVAAGTLLAAAWLVAEWRRSRAVPTAQPPIGVRISATASP